MKTLHWLLVLLTACLLFPLSPPVSGTAPVTSPEASALSPWIDIWVGIDMYDNLEPAVAYNSRHDEYLVVWVDKLDSSTWRIWARRVSGRGQLRSWYVVATSAGKRCTQPKIAYSPPQDRYMVVYMCWSLSLTRDVYAQMVPGDGSAPTLSPILIRNNSGYPAIAYNSQWDEFLVGYEYYSVPNETRVSLERRNPETGSLKDSQDIPGGGSGMRRAFPSLAYDPHHNRYLVTYLFEANAPGDIRSILVSADLGTMGSEMHIWDHTAVLQGLPPLVAAGHGEYLVVYSFRHMAAPPPSNEIHASYARWVNAVGIPYGSAFALALGSYPFDIRKATALAYTAGYGYLVGLAYAQSTGVSSRTYARYVLPGTQAPTDELAIDTSAYRAISPAIACNGGGTCLMAESYQPTSSANYEIRGRLISVEHVYLPVTRKEVP